MSVENTDTKERWDNYRKANTEKPLVRNNELREVFGLLNPKEGEVVFEVGTGNGYLTLPIAQAIGSGKVITADVGEDNLQSVIKRNTANLSIETLLFNDDEMFVEVQEGYFDAVATIATLHHFDSRKKETGENGRKKALQDFYRILKTGGRLIVADVAQNTISQRYFDAIDNPQHCFPEGHPHDFFTTARLGELLKNIGFRNIGIEIKRVPWQFTSENEAKNFVHTIHNAKCSVEESFAVAQEYLGFNKVNNHFELGWELFFATAEK